MYIYPTANVTNHTIIFWNPFFSFGLSTLACIMLNVTIAANIHNKSNPNDPIPNTVTGSTILLLLFINTTSDSTIDRIILVH